MKTQNTYGQDLLTFKSDFQPSAGFVRFLENRESHGILFFSFPGLESHGILCRVMESHGKLNHCKKNYESIFIVYHDRQTFH